MKNKKKAVKKTSGCFVISNGDYGAESIDGPYTPPQALAKMEEKLEDGVSRKNITIINGRKMTISVSLK